jgi:hypothetical protein
MTFRDLGRELSRLGTVEDRVKVLDVDHSATTYKLPQIEQRLRQGVFYLRSPVGTTAQDMKELFDRTVEPAFRYSVTSGIGTDYMELLTPDEFARRYFSSSNQIIRIEGARRTAREQLDEMFDEMKADFSQVSFPHLDDFVISGYKKGDADLSTEVKLLVYDDDFRSMSKIERDIAIKLSEDNLHREITAGRHLVKDTRPEIILSTTAKATDKGKEYLNGLASYLLERDGGIQTEARRDSPTPAVQPPQPSAYKTLVRAFPKTREDVRQPAEIVNSAATEFQVTLGGMTSFKNLEFKMTPQGLHIQFPKKIFGGRTFTGRELTELKAVNSAILGSPGLHDGWNAYYTYEKSERLLKIRFTTPDQELQTPWIRLGI